MSKITASLVKELRKLTGVSIVDCKKALIKVDGDIELAIKFMHEINALKMKDKTDNPTNNGVIKIKINGNYGVVLEVNCQTDFVAKSNVFQEFANKVLSASLVDKINDINVLKMKFEKERIDLINQTNENINIHRVAILEGNIVGSYLHGVRIGVLIAARNGNKELIKQIAMHIAASKPEFIKPENIPLATLEKRYQVELDIAMHSGKEKKVIEKIVKGRMEKFINKISLTCQNFVIEPNKMVGPLLKENNIDITSFVRFELGENIKG